MKILPQNIAVLDDSQDRLLSKYVESAGRLDHDAGIAVHYLPHIRPGMVVVDAGAAIGDHTIAYANAAGAANVHAFECSPYMAECLRYNCPSCHVHEVALSDHNGVTMFHANFENAGGSYCENHRDGIPVRCVTLDSFGISKVGFIKWDIEGMEIKAIRGGRDTIWAGRPVMMIEVIEPQLARAGGSVKELFELLTELHYSWHAVIGTINDIGEYFELCCTPK